MTEIKLYLNKDKELLFLTSKHVLHSNSPDVMCQKKIQTIIHVLQRGLSTGSCKLSSMPCPERALNMCCTRVSPPQLYEYFGV